MMKIIYPEDPNYDDYKGIFDKCEHCGVLVNFDLLDDEDVITDKDGYENFWGFKVERPHVVIGFICPECGGRNMF